MTVLLKKKLKDAQLMDPSIFCDRRDVTSTLGKNPDYLLDYFDITKKDLIRLERLGFAIKARYETENKGLKKNRGITGPHRVRWILFTEALKENEAV